MQLIMNQILLGEQFVIMDLRTQMARQGYGTPNFKDLRELAVYIRDDLNLGRCATNRTTYSFTKIDED
jgi:hypothetical protein